MKALLLAAGRGTRLAPITDGMPKCMVKYEGKAIIDHLIDTMLSCSISDIVVVKGYKGSVLEDHLSGRKIKFYTNDNFQNTNMVHSLFCAQEEFDDDLIISYSDIVYSKSVLDTLKEEMEPISVVVDLNWKELWKMRMDDPLSDAESMKLNKGNFIEELGNKPNSYAEIQGQYIGLLKIRRDALTEISSFYHSLTSANFYHGDDLKNMYMTEFIQLIIDHLMPVKAVVIRNNWLEVDSQSDLDAYSQNQYKVV